MTPDPVFPRKTATDDDLMLRREAIRWMAELPEAVRPVELGRAFPRIVNAIAAKWFDAVGCRQYLSGLQFDDRGGRQGFSFAVVQEIAALREHFDAVYPPGHDVWQKAFDAGQR